MQGSATSNIACTDEVSQADGVTTGVLGFAIGAQDCPMNDSLWPKADIWCGTSPGSPWRPSAACRLDT